MNYQTIFRILLSAILLISYSAAAPAASFRCHGDITKVEKLICSNIYASLLDDKLFEIYSAKLEEERFQDEPKDKQIRREQKKWLDKRNLCRDIDCIKNEYEIRIDQLTSVNRKGNIPLISAIKAESICNEVVKYANSGRLKAKIYDLSTPSEKQPSLWKQLNIPLSAVFDLDYNEDGKIENIGVVNWGGTCSSSSILDLDVAKKSGAYQEYNGFSDEDIENDEGLRWGNMGKDDFFLMVQNEPIVVTAHLAEDAEDVSIVSWFREGKKRPLCLTSALGVEVVAVERKDPELCDFVANGDVPFLEWNTVSDEQVLERLRSELPVLSAAKATLDINEDGQLENVLLVNNQSSAGCGTSWQSLDVYPTNSSEEKQPVALTFDNFSGPLSKYSEQWSDIQLFMHGGRSYLMANGPDGVGVYSLWKNEIRTWCTYKLREQISIDRLYPPGGGYLQK
ncbi:MAG: hypothetical protein FP821_06625 [Sideroxydans sp.]|nr:hypothetical protein [Sideroxydans sp.]